MCNIDGIFKIKLLRNLILKTIQKPKIMSITVFKTINAIFSVLIKTFNVF